MEINSQIQTQQMLGWSLYIRPLYYQGISQHFKKWPNEKNTSHTRDLIKNIQPEAIANDFD